MVWALVWHWTHLPGMMIKTWPRHMSIGAVMPMAFLKNRGNRLLMVKRLINFSQGNWRNSIYLI